MKKVLALILIVLMLVLSGCKSESEEHKIIKDWVLDYALERYEEQYGGYGVIGNFIIQGEITSDDLEQLEKNQYAKIYLIMIVDESGRGRLYNVFILYEDAVTLNNMFDARGLIKESQIIEVDVEEALYYD